MTIQATLFDMDGLLIDSEILWHEAEIEIFGALGVDLGEATNRSTKGLFVDEVVEYWYERYPWSGPSKSEVVALLLARVGDLVEYKGRLLPGAERALELTLARGPVALASSTPMSLIERCLQHFGLADRFASLHSAEFEPFGKPHPGVFLTAAASLSVSPGSLPGPRRFRGRSTRGQGGAHDSRGGANFLGSISGALLVGGPRRSIHSRI